MKTKHLKKSIYIVLALAYAMPSFLVSAGEVIPLYSGTIPNSIPHSLSESVEERGGQFSGYKGATTPTLEIVLPKNASKLTPAIVICPGGGYVRQVYRKEGTALC